MKVKGLSFIKLVFLSAFIFLIIVLLIELLYALTGKESIAQIIANISNIKYLIKKGVSSLLYGIIMALFLKKKAKILNK